MHSGVACEDGVVVHLAGAVVAVEHHDGRGRHLRRLHTAEEGDEHSAIEGGVGRGHLLTVQ